MNRTHTSTFRNADFFVGESVLSEHLMRVSDKGLIENYEIDELKSNINAINLGGLNAIPGLIDLKVTGINGLRVEECKTIDDLVEIDGVLLQDGVTRWCPTYVSPTSNQIQIATQLSQECQGTDIGVIGWNFEELNIGDCNKKIPAIFSSMNLSNIKNIAGYSKVLLTISPKSASLDIIKKFSKIGIKIFIKHSETSIEYYSNSSGIGISQSPTHLISSLKNGKKFHLIDIGSKHCNGQHLSILKKSLHQGQLIAIKNRTEEDISFSSSSSIFSGLKFLVQRYGIPFDEAIRMCSTYPANMLDIRPRHGSLEKLSTLDMVTLSNYFVIKSVYREGKLKNH